MTNNFGFVEDTTNDFGFIEDTPKTVKPQVTKPQPKKVVRPAPKPIIDNNPTEYQKILQDNTLTKEQKAQKIQAIGEAERKQADKDLNKYKAKAYTGAGLEIASAAIPVGAGARLGASAIKYLTPRVGRLVARDVATGLTSGAASGALSGIGQGMIENKDLKGIAQSGLQGAAIGATAGGAVGATTGKLAQNARATEIAEKKLKKALTNKPVVNAKPIQEVENKVNLSSLKSNILSNKFETGNLKDHMVINKGQKGFKASIADQLSYDTEVSQREFNKIISEISQNPEKLRDSLYLSELENKVQKIVDRTPYGNEMEVAAPYWEKFYKAVGDSHNYNNFKMKTTGQLPDDLKKRSLEQSILKAEGTPKEIKEIIKKDAPTYEILKNEDVIAQAVNDVENNFQGELTRLMGTDDFDALDYEKSRQIAKRLFDAGQHEAGMELIDRVSENATKKGQAIQALSLWSNMTPEGAVFKAQKLLKEYNKKNPKKKVELTPEQTETIRNLQNEALNATDEVTKNQAFARTAKFIGELVPKNAMQKLKAYRNIALLLNPKTLGRNIVGNALFNTVETASKALAVPIDRAIGLFTGKKTRVLPQLGEAGKGLVEGATTGTKEAIEGIDTRGLGQRFDLSRGKVFQSKPMQALETALDIGLRVPDRAFYEATFAESVANMLKAQGLQQPTQEILEQAEKEALESVFQNKSVLSDLALGTRKNLNRVGTQDFGLGDALIPYAQTPANIAQQGINYSPAGLGKGLYNAIKKGDQRQASLDIARGLVGSGLIGGGYAAAQSGLMTPSQFADNPQTNKKIKENLAILGIRPDQINGVWYSPFQPVSTSLAVGGAMARGENPLQAGINTVVDLPFLQGISRGLRDLQEGNYAQAGANVLSQIPSQFVPTFGSQVAQYIDPYQRETYDPNVWQRGVNQALSKVPLASQTLPVKRDVTGQPIERYDTEGLQRAFDVFASPTYVNERKNDVVLDELKNIYENTGETKHLLPSVQKNISFNDTNGEKQKIKLTGEQLSEYQRVLGQLNYNSINDLMNSSYYNSLSEADKIKVISARLQDNNAYVKNQLFGVPLDKKNNNSLAKKRERILSRQRSIKRKQYKNNLDEMFNEVYYQE